MVQSPPPLKQTTFRPSQLTERNPAWVESGGITGRGILVDYASWATKNKIPLSHFTQQTIPLAHLQSIITEHNITFHPGDILFIRSGFSVAFNALTPSEQKALAQRPSADFLGVESSEAMLRFLWENQFAAVAGDAPAFERCPVTGDHVDERYILHEWLLAGWGMPIGEMFDLETLAETCERLGRWSFFLVSVPLKVSFETFPFNLCTVFYYIISYFTIHKKSPYG